MEIGSWVKLSSAGVWVGGTPAGAWPAGGKNLREGDRDSEGGFYSFVSSKLRKLELVKFILNPKKVPKVPPTSVSTSYRFSASLLDFRGKTALALRSLETST